MTVSKIPAWGETATFFVNGSKRGEGVLLGVPAAYAAVAYFVFHTIGWALVSVWLVTGWSAFPALDKRRAARRAAAGGGRVMVIPLEQVTSVRTRKPAKAAGMRGG